MQFVGADVLAKFRRSVESLLPDWEGKVVANEPDMLEVVNQAKHEWLASQKYFNSVSDPDLIDHAIMLTDAAQKKYMYLLRQAKAHGVKALNPQPVAATEGESTGMTVQTAGY